MMPHPQSFSFVSEPANVQQINPAGIVIDVPAQGSSIRTLHASIEGAKDSSERAARQALVLLSAYRDCGDLTDIEMAATTGIQKTSVIPRRRELQKRGLVVEVSHRKNPASGVSNTTFGLAGQR